MAVSEGATMEHERIGESLERVDYVAGEDRPRIAQALLFYGLMFLEAGYYQEAKESLEQSVAILESRFDRYHESLRWPLSKLSTTLFMLGDYTEARRLRDREIAIVAKINGPRHARMLTARLLMALNLICLDEYEQARAQIDMAFVLFGRGVLNRCATPTEISLHYRLALELRDRGEGEDALRLFKIAAAHVDPSRTRGISDWAWDAYHDPGLRNRIHEAYTNLLCRIGLEVETEGH